MSGETKAIEAKQAQAKPAKWAEHSPLTRGLVLSMLNVSAQIAIKGIKDKKGPGAALAALGPGTVDEIVDALRAALAHLGETP